MCDELTQKDEDAYLRRMGNLSRRRFNAVAAGAAAAMAVPGGIRANALTESDVIVPTPDGEADCYFVHPADGAHAAVLVWPDIRGLRPAFRQMGARLASSGYAVLVVNPYYRDVKAPVVAEGESFQDPAVRERIMPMAMSLTPEVQMIDATAFVAYLDQQPAVDVTRRMGTTGYCMGGPITMRTAAAVPERIGAGASFHGGRLVTDGPDSPHLLVPEMRASFLFAIAENDDEREPEVKDVLRQAYADAGLPVEIDVYAGTMHGWCALDSAVYNEAQAERAWARLLALLDGTLA